MTAAQTEHQDNVGHAILTTLKNYGIDTVFGIPGTHNLEFYRSLPRLGIRHVTTRHEQGAGFGADGWSLQTGLPGVVITTSGPGLLNMLSPAALSFAESRPMILLAPGPPLGAEFADIGALHETKDTRAAAEAVTEWARRVSAGKEAVQAVHDAFHLFRTGRPRPVVIEVPLDVLEGHHGCDPADLEARPEPAPLGADATKIREAAELLSQAVSPVIFYGGGSLGAGTRTLTRLAEQLDAPVICTLNGRAAIPESHPLSVGSSLRLKAAHELVNDADVLLVIGSKVGEAEMWPGPLAPRGKVIRIDLLESQLDKNLESTLGIRGDATVAIDQLLEAEQEAVQNHQRKTGAARAAAARAEINSESRVWSPDSVSISEAIAEVLPDNVVLGADSSQVCYYGTANHVPVQEPNSYLYMATYATLGYGLPASIGAKIASPDRPVVCVAGDGALMFSIQELVTAVEQEIDLVVICVDNGGYKEIEENEASVNMPPIGVRLTQPKWPTLGEALGAVGHTITRADQLAGTVNEAMSTGGVHLIHAPLALFAPKEAAWPN